MKAIYILFLVIPCFLKAQMDSSGYAGIKWESDLTWEQIKQKAREENKFIFVDAYATWCVPCKQMDREVYTDEKVGLELNAQFISVKVQMDQTSRDNEHIRAWYNVATSFNEQYKIEGYPSFLFFSPQGELAHRGIGLLSQDEFIALAKKALTNPIGKYKTNLEEFNRNELDFLAMPFLARMAWDRNEKETSIRIAKRFKEEYLDKLRNKEAFTKDNLLFISEFSYELLNSDDRYFRFFFQHSDSADHIMGMQVQGKLVKRSNQVVLLIITKEEIKDKIYRDEKPIAKPNPNWSAISESIRKKYGDKFLNIIFPDEQILYYEALRNWKMYAHVINAKIEKYPPKQNGHLFGSRFGDAWHLNYHAWILFQYCNDKRILKKGLKWVNMAIELEAIPEASSSYLDTKANILYKLGRVSEAIANEEEAIARLPSNSKTAEGYRELLHKMKSGIHTWQD